MGKPMLSNVSIFHHKFIVVEGDTRRTETSQYPEEKKAIAIS